MYSDIDRETMLCQGLHKPDARVSFAVWILGHIGEAQSTGGYSGIRSAGGHLLDTAEELLRYAGKERYILAYCDFLGHGRPDGWNIRRVVSQLPPRLPVSLDGYSCPLTELPDRELAAHLLRHLILWYKRVGFGTREQALAEAALVLLDAVDIRIDTSEDNPEALVWEAGNREFIRRHAEQGCDYAPGLSPQGWNPFVAPGFYKGHESEFPFIRPD